MVAAGELHLVRGAPTARRPAYVVYTDDPKDPEVLALALDILRDIAKDAEKT